MRQRLTSAAIVLSFTTVVFAEPLIFKKVDFFEQQGEDEEKRDARLELDPETRMLSITDEAGQSVAALQ
jgi:hypothetical protein